MAYKAVLIDDNKNTVLSLEYSLEWENLGIELAGTAYDGRSGKELIEKTDPDIIISDINMPYLDGFTMVEESGKAEDRIIIVITGYDKFQFCLPFMRSALISNFNSSSLISRAFFILHLLVPPTYGTNKLLIISLVYNWI